MRKMRSLKELFDSAGSRRVGNESIPSESNHHQGALVGDKPAPRRRGAVSVDVDASLKAPLAMMLAAGSTAKKRLDRHTVEVATWALMFLLFFFHAMSVAAAQV